MHVRPLSQIRKSFPASGITVGCRTPKSSAAQSVIALAYVALAESVGAQLAPEDDDSRLSWGIEAGWSSGYAWRGLMISDAPVTEAATWLYASGFTLVAWQNAARSDTSDGTRPEVSDLFVAYEHEWRKLTIEPSLETFHYRDPLTDEASRSAEAAVRLSYAAGPVQVFGSHAVDISAYDGASYSELGLAHDRSFNDRAHFEIALRTGLGSSKFNEVNVGIPKRAVNFVGIDASLTYYVTARFYLRPHLELSKVVDEEIQVEVSDVSPATFGLAMGMEF
jgi:hypothetical protein